MTGKVLGSIKGEGKRVARAFFDKLRSDKVTKRQGDKEKKNEGGLK